MLQAESFGVKRRNDEVTNSSAEENTNEHWDEEIHILRRLHEKNSEAEWKSSVSCQHGYSSNCSVYINWLKHLTFSNYSNIIKEETHKLSQWGANEKAREEESSRKSYSIFNSTEEEPKNEEDNCNPYVKACSFLETSQKELHCVAFSCPEQWCKRVLVPSNWTKVPHNSVFSRFLKADWWSLACVVEDGWHKEDNGSSNESDQASF